MEFPRGGCWGHYGPDPGAHPHPYQHLQPEEEDGNYEIVFQLHCKEILRQLLAMLSPALVLSPHMAAGPYHRHGPKER